MDSFLKHIKKDRYTLAIQSLEKENNTPQTTNLTPPPEISNLQKQAEWRASRSIVQKLAPNTNITHNNYGAPILSNGKAISISHTKELCGVIISQKNTAIDLEKISERTKLLSSKFLNDKEMRFSKDQINATICWSAKECLFKIHQKGSLDFKKDLQIISIKSNHVTASLMGRQYLLHLEIIEDHVLVYYFD
jgi:phosphopantetheinyl transferase